MSQRCIRKPLDTRRYLRDAHRGQKRRESVFVVPTSRTAAPALRHGRLPIGRPGDSACIYCVCTIALKTELHQQAFCCALVRSPLLDGTLAVWSRASHPGVTCKIFASIRQPDGRRMDEFHLRQHQGVRYALGSLFRRVCLLWILRIKLPLEVPSMLGLAGQGPPTK